MNEWEEEVRSRQGEMFQVVHLRQRRGQAADQAGREQTLSTLFGYQPAAVGCHLILREQKPAERRPWRVRNVRRNCVWSAMYAGIACGPQGARRVVCAFGWKGLASLARTAKRVREALRGLGGTVEVESYRGTANEQRWQVCPHSKRRYLSRLPNYNS